MDFYKGLKHSSAFSSIIDDNGNFVDAEQTDYMLFEGTYFPFVVFG